MKSTFFTRLIKWLISLIFFPFKKSKWLLSFLFNSLFKEELESLQEQGELFPLQHIHRSIRLAKKLPVQDFTILDIGGGIGATLRLYRKYFPSNRIMVFEPVAGSYQTIKAKYENDAATEIYNVAAGNVNSKTEINIANRITSSSLLPLSAEIRSDYYDDRSLGMNRIETIETVRLDDFSPIGNDTIGIMKMDVQGYELKVLEGAENLLNRVSIILLEAGNHDVYVGSPKYYDIDNYLRKNNFTLCDIIPSVLDNGRLKEWDVIYINNELL